MLIEKIKVLFGSIRFWIVSLIAGATLLQIYSTSGIDFMVMTDVVKVWLGVVVGIGTLDSVFVKLGEALAKKKK